MPRNLYVHFPFCRRKCTYCSLYSRVSESAAERDEYVESLAKSFDRGQSLKTGGQASFSRGQTPILGGQSLETLGGQSLETIYFGGGSPGMCNLVPLLDSLAPYLDSGTEFTVELHPEDVSDSLLRTLKAGGVNRISMGVQSLEDKILSHMNRGYTATEAHHAFDLVKKYFDNAGIDLIIGYPGESLFCGDRPSFRGDRPQFSGDRPSFSGDRPSFCALSSWGLRHCSVYALENTRGLKNVPDDDWVMDRLREVAAELEMMGLYRYEISNYAVPGFECRHNLAVWRGEDYLGLGEGARGRIGLKRTVGVRSDAKEEAVTPEFDRKERTLFRLRTREGLDASAFPEWQETLERFVNE